MASSQLALLGGKPIGGAKPPKYPLFSKSAIRQVADILESGRTVGLGRTHAVIDKAEQAISRYHDGRHVMVVNSGKAALMCQHYGRSAEPGFPEEFKPYVDSLVFTFRLTPLVAALFPTQVRRLDAQVEARQENAAVFGEAMRGCELVRLPRYRKGFRPSYHMLTMNFRPEKAGVRRETFSRALAAEGVGAWPYVPESIHRWRRLQWKGYRGPVPLWLDALKRAGTDCAAQELPNSDFKVAHGLEMGWNPFCRRDPKGMKRMAGAFLKVQDHLAELRAWKEEQDARRENDENRVIGAAKRAAASYRRG